jgi:peptidoglycan/LPS O-acetylase OafA/YrhL
VSTATTPKTALRTDIQALRAVAVCGVVFFHLWPGVIRGGYVGVDVFFVISGYLITSHLFGELARHGRIRLGAFWSRRMRRLLPAALLVLTVTALATYLLVPSGLWVVHFREIIASALYGENWILAHDSVDYLNAENAASSVQHYWSLSVEEQFYVVWPLLLLAATSLYGGTTSRRLRATRIALGVVFVTSLVASIITTAVSPGPAYFVTYTRAWEFAAGGLVAGLPAVTSLLPRRAIPQARTLGWVLILGTVAFYTKATPFPGWTALIPVLGTALVIWAGEPAPDSRFALVARLRPVQYLGTISYGLYLWHWPPIVLCAYVIDGPRGFLTSVAILALAIALASITYRWVENPLRFSPLLTGSQLRTFVVGTAAGLAVVALAGSGLWITRNSEKESLQATSGLLRAGADCFGAAATLGADAPCENPKLKGVLLPRPAARLDDTGGAYSCYDPAPSATLKSCTYGSKRPGALKVAIVGDSHAASLVPGLNRQLGRVNWSLDTYVGRGCGWSTTTADDPCKGHRDALRQRFEHGPKYDVILVALRRDPIVLASQPNPVAADLADAWKPVLARGTKVVAIADDPWLPTHMSGCMAQADDLAGFEDCTMTPAEAWRLSDPLPHAVELAGKGASLVDLTRAFCEGDVCPAVIGHVIVYRDEHHITATFSKTYAPFVVRAIQRAIR